PARSARHGANASALVVRRIRQPAGISAGRRAAGVGCGGVGHRTHVYEERKGGPMASAKRILVLAAALAGDWPPLAAVTVGLHQAGHAVQCSGDPAIAGDFAAAGIAVEVVPAEDPLGTFTAQWRATGASGPLPLRVWADACWPAVCALVSAFKPQAVVSQLFTAEL